MKPKTKKILNIIALLASIALFFYVVILFGKGAFEIIALNVNFLLLGTAMVLAFVSFMPYTMRFKVLLEAYVEKVPFWMLFRHTLATFAVSYVTPFSRLGGEPARIYMLNKEAGVDYKTGSTAVLLDKYVDILGASLFLIAGLFLVLTLPNSPRSLQVLLISLILVIFLILGVVYARGIREKGYFSSFFIIFRLNKIRKISHWLFTIKDVEAKMNNFFKYHKKKLFLSTFYYIVNAVVNIALIKILLLSIGFNFSILEVILIISLWGLLSFGPTPAGLGALEAGQSALFVLLEGDGSIGFAMTLLLRFGYLVMVALGFIFLSQFSRGQIWKKKDSLKEKEIKEVLDV